MPSTVTLPTASAWWRRWGRTLTVDIQPTKIRTLLQSRFALLTVLSIAVSLASVGYIARELTPRAAALGAGSRSASRPTVAVPAVTAKRSLPAGDYDIVVSRNLFNPTRTETGAATAAATASAPGAPRPTLYGVVLSDDAPIAYLEDPRPDAWRAIAPGTPSPEGPSGSSPRIMWCSFGQKAASKST